MSAFWDKVSAMRKNSRQLTTQKESAKESAPVVSPAPDKTVGKKKKTSAKVKVEAEINLNTEQIDASETAGDANNDSGTDKDS